jgi:hypothetical protein
MTCDGGLPDGGPDGGDAGDGGDDPVDERVCDGQAQDGAEATPCSCQALDLGFCVQYDAMGGTLPEGRCAELGGVEIEDTCPTDDIAGECVENGECSDPFYRFYSTYEGELGDYLDIDAVEAGCIAGELVSTTCAQWTEP